MEKPVKISGLDQLAKGERFTLQSEISTRRPDILRGPVYRVLSTKKGPDGIAAMAEETGETLMLDPSEEVSTGGRLREPIRPQGLEF